MIQEQTINYILQNKDSSMITLNNLTDDYFSDYKQEYKFIKMHLDKYGNVPDLTTFANAFPNFEIFNVTESPTYLLTELIKDKNKRFLAENYNKIRNYIMSDDVDSALQILREASDLSFDGVSLQAVDILHDTSRYEAYLERAEDYSKYFISTGFRELDMIIGGWDVKEELATIVARTGVGKTWTLLKCAAAAAQQGKNVGIYSGEMSENKVGYRIDTLLGHLSNGSLIHGNPSIKNEYKKYLEELSFKVPGSIKVLTPKMINGPAGVSALRAFIEKYNLDILFIDQHSLLDDDRKAKNPVEKAANISKDLKLLQVIKQIPIISVSQQNRSNTESGTFETTQLAQSDRIAQDSTIIIFVEKKDDLMKLHLVKSRDTENGKILTYRVNFNDGSFQFIPDEKSSPETIQETGYSEDEVF